MAHFFMTWNGQALPDFKLPDGFSYRTYQPGDEEGWLSCCNGGGLGTEEWGTPEFKEKMLNAEGVYAENIYFIIEDATGRIAATATGRCHADKGEIHMVAANPEFRGLRLGKAITRKALECLVEKGYTAIQLETDDWRTAAIKTYEWLGFVRNPENPAE